MYALLGLGLVLVHRVTGVVHVAHGATAMWTAYVYVELRDTGELVVPLGGLPARLPVADDPPAAVAVALALLASAALGLLLHVLVFRPLRGAPPLATLVASVGVLVVLQALAVLQFGTENRFAAPLLPNRPVDLLGLQVPLDRLLLALVAVAVAAVLHAISARTRFGLASRAAAEDDEAVALLGWSPDRLAAANWVIASVLAGVAGILLVPLTALNPLTYTLFVVPALAAALVARLDGFAATVAAALALGAAQSLLVQLQVEQAWLARLNLRAALPFLVVVAVVVVRGQLVPARGSPAASRLPPAGRPRRPLLTAAVAVPAAVALLAATGGDLRAALVTSAVGAVLALSVVVLTGYVGQLSVAQMAFAGVAAFALSRLGAVPFPVAPVLAALAAALVGLVLGLAARRVRGVDLAVLTLAAGVAVDEVLFRNPVLTGGLGGSAVEPPGLAGLELAPTTAGGAPALGFALLVVAVVVACCLAVARLRVSSLGRRMLAVRVNERGAAASGIDVARTKLVAFALSALLAGLGGALLGYAQGSVSYESFGVFASLSVLAVAYLGGIASIAGACLAGLLVPGGVLTHVLDVLPGLGPEHQLLLSGLALVAVVVLAPQGLSGLRRPVARR